MSEAPHRKDRRAWKQAIDAAKKWDAWDRHMAMCHGPCETEERLDAELYAAMEALRDHLKGLGLL